MTAKAALCIYFLQGKIVSIKNCYLMIGLSNPGREIPRCIEKPFGVTISRVTKNGENQWGVTCTWTEYRLNPLIEKNKEGIEKMKDYVKKQMSTSPPKTEKQQKKYEQARMFL